MLAGVTAGPDEQARVHSCIYNRPQYEAYPLQYDTRRLAEIRGLPHSGSGRRGVI